MQTSRKAFGKSLAALLVLVSLATTAARADELAHLKVLYVGERAADFTGFLNGKVAAIQAIPRSEFKPKDAAAFDVVLFDWPQNEETRDMRRLAAPLGAREEWTKPTVLLGSAGLNLAVAWKLKGGSGCTCLDPLAYDLRSHEIFEHPFRIDRSKMVSIGTPPDFVEEIRDPQIKVLPLVADRDRKWHPGWCSYSRDFAQYPDVEFFCGGVNHKTPTAAALWRQGNLLHFGFEQSPAEMNESGRQLLLNAIAYINRFSEDRPIAFTPSVFGGPIACKREVPARWLRAADRPMEWTEKLIAPELWRTVSAKGDRKVVSRWFDEHAKFLHPDSHNRLDIDEELTALGVGFDEPAFFEKTIAGLRSSNDADAARARRLLARYVPCGPASDGGVNTADSWAAWWTENQPYLFASDAGDYRWYIDPLAKKRRVPTSELRGPRRADLGNQSITTSR